MKNDLNGMVKRESSKLERKVDGKINEKIVFPATDVNTKLEMMKEDIRKIGSRKDGYDSMGGIGSAKEIEEVDTNFRQMM